VVSAPVFARLLISALALPLGDAGLQAQPELTARATIRDTRDLRRVRILPWTCAKLMFLEGRPLHSQRQGPRQVFGPSPSVDLPQSPHIRSGIVQRDRLSLDESFEVARLAGLENFEFDAPRPGIDDENCVHGARAIAVLSAVKRNYASAGT